MIIKDIVATQHFDEYYSKQSETKLLACSANRDGQLLRFKALSEINDLTDKSVLDVGCGHGEFYFFCRKNKMKLNRYVGIDLNLKVVKQANEYFPELDIRHMDMLENNFESNSFDYVIASLLFCFETNNWRKRAQIMIKKMFKIAKYGVAMNFLRWREQNRNPLSHYERYDDITKIIERHTLDYIIRADYKKNDFTIYMIP